jgi:hypothetical protein
MQYLNTEENEKITYGNTNQVFNELWVKGKRGYENVSSADNI